MCVCRWLFVLANFSHTIARTSRTHKNIVVAPFDDTLQQRHCDDRRPVVAAVVGAFDFGDVVCLRFVVAVVVYVIFGVYVVFVCVCCRERCFANEHVSWVVWLLCR